MTSNNGSHSSHPSHGIALVLGGGGAAGNAWQLGVIAGLAEAGYDLTELADLVIGTSSGSTAAAAVRRGMSAADLYAAALQPPAGPAAAAPNDSAPRPASLPPQELFERLRAIGAAAGSAEDLHTALGSFALECDAVLRPAPTGVERSSPPACPARTGRSARCWWWRSTRTPAGW